MISEREIRTTTHGVGLPREGSAPMPAPTVPQFRWPSERHMIPERCTHCSARLLRGDVPTASFPAADQTCQMCSRTVCELIHDSTPTRPTPETFAALPVGKRGPKTTGSDRMVERVLPLLRRAGDTGLSGQNIADVLGCHPQVARNTMTALRARGYTVVRASGRYVLVDGER